MKEENLNKKIINDIVSLGISYREATELSLVSTDLKKDYEKLCEGYPIQYLIGYVDFYGNIIKVDKRVLIPRFETEGLVEIALSYLTNTNIDVVDLGTGSGCIPITLKKKLPNINIDAVDISSDALEVAKENAKLNNVDINFNEANALDNTERGAGGFGSTGTN